MILPDSSGQVDRILPVFSLNIKIVTFLRKNGYRPIKRLPSLAKKVTFFKKGYRFEKRVTFSKKGLPFQKKGYLFWLPKSDGNENGYHGNENGYLVTIFHPFIICLMLTL